MWIIPNNLSSVFAQDTGVSKEDLTLPELNIESSLMWRSKPSRSQTWSRRWKRVKWFRLLCGRILKPSRWISFEDEYTESLGVIPANPFQSPDNEKGNMTPDTFGHTSGGQLTLFGQSGRFSRMLRDISQKGSYKSSPIWKEWVTGLRQEYSQRKKLALRTEERGCLSWLTPKANEKEQDLEKFQKRMEKYPNGTKMPTLSNQVKQNWMTPDVSDRRSAKSKQQGLSNQVESWRTQNASDGEGGIDWPLINGEKKVKAPKIKLRDQVHHKKNWPTPTSRDHKDGTAESCKNVPSNGLLGREIHNMNGKSRGQLKSMQAPSQRNGKTIRRQLNPSWVEQLMGVPTQWTQLPIEWIVSDCAETGSYHKQPRKHGGC